MVVEKLLCDLAYKQLFFFVQSEKVEAEELQPSLATFA